jgi:N-acetyl-anhydromuramyl-L-alanine amidase AmpD
VGNQLRPFLDDASASELAYPARADRPWKYIVLHHSAHEAGSYDEIDREHRKVLGYDGCGYHFVIGNGTGSDDGQIEIAQRWVNQKHGVHCRNARSSEIDEYGIGICLVGDFEQQDPTPKQLAAARALISYLSQRYNIADDHVETHAHLASTPTVCPGSHFPTASALLGPDRPTGVSTGTARLEIRRKPMPTSWRMTRRSKANF